MKSSLKLTVTFFVLAAVVTLAGCAKKKVATQTPPPPPPPAAPTATLTASQSSVEKGQSLTLSWETANASDITIDGLGTVNASGSREVSPADSITYHLLAKGPGGSAEASARVTVTIPPPPAAPPAPSIADLFAQNVKDIYFDYDKYDIRPSDQQIAEANAKFFAAHPELKVVIEGHCDERGSEEYNLALGDNRANATKALLDKLGIGADRLKVISYGKEKPFCTDNSESCWQMNRRAHFAIAE